MRLYHIAKVGIHQNLTILLSQPKNCIQLQTLPRPLDILNCLTPDLGRTTLSFGMLFLFPSPPPPSPFFSLLLSILLLPLPLPSPLFLLLLRLFLYLFELLDSLESQNKK